MCRVQKNQRHRHGQTRNRIFIKLSYEIDFKIIVMHTDARNENRRVRKRLNFSRFTQAHCALA